uniref:Addiction module killer protein n=1 Tax=Chlorobium chlorochromatii (strain CaD3) TaxID=340177 RepID=Q3AR08_CHLCH
MTTPIQILEYVDQHGNCAFRDWFNYLDSVSAARVAMYLERVAQGNFSNVAPIGAGLSEIKINVGPGYRVYFAKKGSTILILLGGSNKKDQSQAIEKAKQLWEEYKALVKQEKNKL